MAVRFAAAGMCVVAADIEEPPLQETVAAITGAGGDATAVICDVSKAEQVEALRDRALEAYGAVHVVCNNAGVGGGGPTHEASLATWKFVIGVNLYGVIHGVHTFGPLLIEQNEGHIVNTASIAGHISAPNMGPYNVTKHAVVTLTETMMAELSEAGSKVGLSVLCPGFVATNIIDSERNRPEEFLDPGMAEPRSEDDEAMSKMIHDFYATQLQPEVVADQVLDAVQNGTFYLFTDNVFDDAVAARHADIAERRNPEFRGHLWEKLLPSD
jgi:NAD(P)-dependent dehydrogenase (short-subunit alcohol dehydrogenase family)